MRIDPATCRNPELLAAEVRRLQTVSDSREPITLTDEEREVLEMLVACPRTHNIMYDEEAILLGLLARTRQPQSNAKKRGET